MIRDLLFRPMLSTVDTITTTIAAVLMLDGHWLASLPVVALGVGLHAWARRKGWQMPAAVRYARKGR
jgi:hypothetical protein